VATDENAAGRSVGVGSAAALRSTSIPFHSTTYSASYQFARAVSSADSDTTTRELSRAIIDLSAGRVHMWSSSPDA
jgi:hypothetical protein